MIDSDPVACGSEPEPGEGKSRPRFAERRSFCCLLLLLFGIGARLPALQGDFIWDDFLLVPRNPMIRSPILVLEAFRHYLFLDAFSGHYRPVQTVSYILDYLVWNKNPFGYHLSNICCQAACGILLYLLLLRILPPLLHARTETTVPSDRHRAGAIAAFLVSLLWVVHPVHSAAVDYISGRADCLVFFFSAAAWLLYLRAREIRGPLLRWSMFLLAMVSALLALCSRESGLMWMLVFLCYLFGSEKNVATARKVAVLAVTLAIVAVYVGLRHLPESRPDNLAGASVNAATRSVLMLRALGDYARLMVFPTNLHVERTVAGPVRSADYLAIGGAVMLGVFLYGARRRGPGRKARVLGAAWFLVAYLPISNLLDLNATVAEHWLYLPSVGFLIFLAGVVVELPARFRKAAVALAYVAVVALTVRSALRSSDWIDPETFFRRTFAAGASDSRIGVNLGVIYATRGEHGKAEAILRKVLQVSPNDTLARSNLALALSQQGKREEADALLEAPNASGAEKVNSQSTTWEGALHLAQLRYKQKDTTGALAILDRALRGFPATWELVRLDSEILRTTGGPQAGLAVLQDFASHRWWHSGAALAMGRLYLETGDVGAAEAAFRHASWLDIHDAQPVSLLALVKIKENRLDEACEIQRRALARQPDEPRQYLMLSEILKKLGRDDEARELLAQVSRMQPIAQVHPAVN